MKSRADGPLKKKKDEQPTWRNNSKTKKLLEEDVTKSAGVTPLKSHDMEPEDVYLQ
jgi:hypothetical protein